MDECSVRGLKDPDVQLSVCRLESIVVAVCVFDQRKLSGAKRNINVQVHSSELIILHYSVLTLLMVIMMLANDTQH